MDHQRYAHIQWYSALCTHPIGLRQDYLALESLLNLFARALPSTNNSAPGRARRTAFIHSVFGSTAPPEVAAVGLEIAQILENVPTSDWEETSVKIVDALARGNVA